MLNKGGELPLLTFGLHLVLGFELSLYISHIVLNRIQLDSTMFLTGYPTVQISKFLTDEEKACDFFIYYFLIQEKFIFKSGSLHMKFESYHDSIFNLDAFQLEILDPKPTIAGHDFGKIQV